MTLKKKIIISIISLLFLIVLFIILVLSPLLLEIKHISQSVPLKKQEVADLEKKLENLNKFKNILPEISSNAEKVNQLFISLRAPIDFREFLEEAAQDSKVAIEISPASLSQAASTDPWQFNLLNLDLAGPFSNFSNFLEKLESGPYLIAIQNLNIISEAKLPESGKFYLGNIKATISIKAYAK